MKLRKTKNVELHKKAEREVTELLRQEKEDIARLKVEQMLRDQAFDQAYDVLELFCEIILSRVQLLHTSCEVPNDLKEAIYSLVWASIRMPIPELKQLSLQFKLKYGEEFYKDAIDNQIGYVNEDLIEKLRVDIADPEVVDEHIFRLSPVPSKPKPATRKGAEAPPPKKAEETPTEPTLLSMFEAGLPPPSPSTPSNSNTSFPSPSTSTSFTTSVGGSGPQGPAHPMPPGGGGPYVPPSHPQQFPTVFPQSSSSLPTTQPYPQDFQYHYSGQTMFGPESHSQPLTQPYVGTTGPQTAPYHLGPIQAGDVSLFLPTPPPDPLLDSATSPAGTDDVEFDELCARFEALKKGNV
jgi:vacuolar protein sorting-associated protein IST1